MEAKKQLDLKIEESDKWQRMYIQTREDIKLHNRMDSTGSTASTAQSPIKSPEVPLKYPLLKFFIIFF